MTPTQRKAIESAIKTLDSAAAVADRPGLMGMCEKAAKNLRAALAEADEPVAWAGYNLDRMADAFARVIDAHDGRNGPFLNPVIMDADLALREFRAIIRRTKTYTHPHRREPLTEMKCMRAICQRASDGYCAPCHAGMYP